MARKIIHQLVDDIDGDVLEPGEGETVLFSLDGKSYEVDLKPANAEKLRAALETYISAGRRAGSGASAGTTARPARRRSSQTDYSGVRAWARENGFEISERGRIPGNVLEAYEAAH